MIPLKEWTNGTPGNNYQDGTQLDAADFESWHKEWLAVLEAVGDAADAAKTNQIVSAIKKIAWGGGGDARPTTLAGYGIADAVTHIASGQLLPAQNIGPIWHDDYNSLLTWRVFNANGANYTGYASVLVGSLLLDTQSTPPHRLRQIRRSEPVEGRLCGATRLGNAQRNSCRGGDLASRADRLCRQCRRHHLPRL